MEPTSPIAPRPRPGFRSRRGVTTHEKAALVATTARALLGVVCLGVAVLYLPPQPVTPILSGVSVLMVVSGSYAGWQLGRREPLLRPYARLVYVGAPALAVLVFVLLPFIGAGGLGPDWSSLVGAR
ncbi:MAG: hypothetical protein ACO3JL_01645 [Myxococcota bacterium]